MVMQKKFYNMKIGDTISSKDIRLVNNVTISSDKASFYFIKHDKNTKLYVTERVKE